ncbi:hypothetical protein [Pandoraea communis]|uniref:hypothetical protein n=1 Tax=Pandoraea communis TaxID=2508297 RepID=UPI00123EEC7F|nr:hypothetical protein [Pandoraea communis]
MTPGQVRERIRALEQKFSRIEDEFHQVANARNARASTAPPPTSDMEEGNHESCSKVDVDAYGRFARRLLVGA